MSVTGNSLQISSVLSVEPGGTFNIGNAQVVPPSTTMTSIFLPRNSLRKVSRKFTSSFKTNPLIVTLNSMNTWNYYRN
jgi:hypothetical protein